MKDKAFLDTNVLVYLYSTDEEYKRECAVRVFEQYDCVTSTQAINEFSSVCTRKWKLPADSIKLAIDEIGASAAISLLDVGIIKSALDLHLQYGYSYYDCLMLASAISNQCNVLISEDMHDRQIIENKLTILNIFRSDRE